MTGLKYHFASPFEYDLISACKALFQSCQLIGYVNKASFVHSFLFNQSIGIAGSEEAFSTEKLEMIFGHISAFAKEFE